MTVRTYQGEQPGSLDPFVEGYLNYLQGLQDLGGSAELSVVEPRIMERIAGIVTRRRKPPMDSNTPKVE